MVKLAEHHLGAEHTKSIHEKPLPTHDNSKHNPRGSHQKIINQPKKF